MESNDKRMVAACIFLAMSMIYLVYEYANPYFPTLMVILLTYPIVFFAGLLWEKQRFGSYLDYLREVGDLVDMRLDNEAKAEPTTQKEAQPIRPDQNKRTIMINRRKRLLN